MLIALSQRRLACHLTLIVQVIAWSLFLHASGCSDASKSSASSKSSSETTVPAGQTPRQIREYISWMQPLLRKHGFPLITMKPIVDDEGVKIIVRGQVVSDTEQGLKDSKIVLYSVLNVSDPPSEIVIRVKYHLSD